LGKTGIVSPDFPQPATGPPKQPPWEAADMTPLPLFPDQVRRRGMFTRDILLPTPTSAARTIRFRSPLETLISKP